MIHRYTDSDKNKPLQLKTNQNQLGDVIINKLRQSVKTTYPVNNGDTMQWSVNHRI